MEYFFVENTIYNIIIFLLLLVLIGVNGFLLFRIRKVKVKAIKTTSDKLLSMASIILIIGIFVLLGMSTQVVGIGTLIIVGILAVATRVLAPLAAGLTDNSIQYEVSHSSGAATIFTQLTRLVHEISYKNIKEIDIEETDVLKLKAKLSIRTIKLNFPLEKKEEVEAFLKKKRVL